MGELQLRLITVEDERSFRAAVVEMERDNPDWTFGFDYDPEEDFERYVDRVNEWQEGRGLIEGHVPASFLVAIVDGEIIGRLSLRHELNDFLRLYGGHIGYGVIPSQRNKGYATEMLRQGLERAASLGIKRVLISCDTDNLASRRVIEKNGGVFDWTTELEDVDIQKHVFWIETQLGRSR